MTRRACGPRRAWSWWTRAKSVRDGAVAVQPDTNVAPRTTVGVTTAGRLLSLEVDGCEPQVGCLWKLGKTLYEMAELLGLYGLGRRV